MKIGDYAIVIDSVYDSDFPVGTLVKIADSTLPFFDVYKKGVKWYFSPKELRSVTDLDLLSILYGTDCV